MISPVLWGIAASALLSGVVAVLAWREHPSPGARAFAVGMAGVTWWLAVMFLGHAFTDGLVLSLTVRLEGIGAAVMAIGWFVFALQYTGRGEYVTWRVLLVLAVYPVVSLPIGLGASQYLELYASWLGYTVSLPPFDIWGWWELVGFVYLYVLLVAGFVQILGLVLNQRLPRPELASLWLFAVAVPMVVGGLHITGLFSPLAVDPTPFGLVVTGLVGFVSISRYDVFQSTPFARGYVIDRLDAGMVVYDGDCRILDYNDWAADVLDVPDDVLGADVRQLLTDQTTLSAAQFDGTDGETAAGAFADAIDRAELTLDGSGDVTYLRVDVSPLERPYGTREGYSILLYDTTVQRRYQMQLERQNERLERLTDVVAHDLRNPLDVGLGQTRRLQQTAQRGNVPDDDLETALDEIQDSMERSVTLVEDMLAMSRGGQQLTDPEKVDVLDVAELAWGYVDTGDLSLAVDGSKPVEGDRQRLVQVFENLYRNTAVHAPNATEVRVGTTPAGVYVEDDGQGIPTDRRDGIFDPGETTQQAGTGLGLSIVREIVRAHSWEIRVTEGTAGGARFEITGLDGS